MEATESLVGFYKVGYTLIEVIELAWDKNSYSFFEVNERTGKRCSSKPASYIVAEIKEGKHKKVEFVLPFEVKQEVVPVTKKQEENHRKEDKATQKQIDFLINLGLGYYVNDSLTKKYASFLIDNHLNG